MKELTSLDQKILNYPVDKIFPIVSDFQTYREWFPKNVDISLIKKTPEKIGSIIQIKFGIVKFKIELTRINQFREIIVQYRGAYEGNGIWYFFESTNGTKLLYEIDLKIKNPIVRLISIFVNINSMHSNVMTKTFEGLENYLNNIYKNEKNGINNHSNSQPKIFSISSN